ncbi:MAG TPA: DUF2267 domain-containing protein [Mycobacteriales bacterium]|nr:DUF2267 domain-containing protein [Mycobacteriales bacterium]
MAVRYREFLGAVSETTGLDTDEARAVAGAALSVLARQLSRADRRRLLDALPANLSDGLPPPGGPAHPDRVAFVQGVSRLSGRPAEEAWLLTHAVFAALAGQEPELVRGLDLPADLGELFSQPYPGGGLTGPRGHQAPLTAEEVQAELRELPYWSGDTSALVRTVELPEDNLDRVLERILLLHRRFGRGPEVRRVGGAADLVVNTAAVGAVTALDIELAHEVDRAIEQAGAGIASG